MASCLLLCGGNAFSLWTGCVCRVDRIRLPYGQALQMPPFFVDMAPFSIKMAPFSIKMAPFLLCNAAISRQWSRPGGFCSREKLGLDVQKGYFVHVPCLSRTIARDVSQFLHDSRMCPRGAEGLKGSVRRLRALAARRVNGAGSPAC